MVIDKSKIAKRIREISAINSFKEFPRDIDLRSESGTLFIRMSEIGLYKNMQKNPAAFEGWGLAVKAIAPELAQNIVIQWNQPSNPLDPHFIRFLYRAIRFAQNYSWVSLSPLDSEAAESLAKTQAEISNWVINFPKSKASVKAQKPEARLERELLDHFQKNPNIECGNQLPMGLFNGIKSEETGRTPRHNSMIDLWSFCNDCFTVYELKIDANKIMGIISELMFYLNVVKDVADGVITYPADAAKSKYRNFRAVLGILPSNPLLTVEGVFLANCLHPLIEFDKNRLFDILNDNSRGIVYKQINVKTLLES